MGFRFHRRQGRRKDRRQARSSSDDESDFKLGDIFEPFEEAFEWVGKTAPSDFFDEVWETGKDVWDWHSNIYKDLSEHIWGEKPLAGMAKMALSAAGSYFGVPMLGQLASRLIPSKNVGGLMGKYPGLGEALAGGLGGWARGLKAAGQAAAAEGPAQQFAQAPGGVDPAGITSPQDTALLAPPELSVATRAQPGLGYHALDQGSQPSIGLDPGYGLPQAALPQPLVQQGAGPFPMVGQEVGGPIGAGAQNVGQGASLGVNGQNWLQKLGGMAQQALLQYAWYKQNLDKHNFLQQRYASARQRHASAARLRPGLAQAQSGLFGQANMMGGMGVEQLQGWRGEMGGMPSLPAALQARLSTGAGNV